MIAMYVYTVHKRWINFYLSIHTEAMKQDEKLYGSLLAVNVT